MPRHSPRHELDNWLDSHGYRHARKPKTPYIKPTASEIEAHREEMQQAIKLREVERHADLMRQGIWKGRKEPRAKRPDPPVVACDWCQNWHRKGKHTRPGAPKRGVVQREIGPSAHATRKKSQTSTFASSGRQLLKDLATLSARARSAADTATLDLVTRASKGDAGALIELRPSLEALRASLSEEKPVTIVVAWTEDTQELAPDQKSWRHDLGERPKLVDVKKPYAAMWRNAGTEVDVGKAREYARKNNPVTGRVMVYPVTEKDPLGRARKDVLEGLGS